MKICQLIQRNEVIDPALNKSHRAKAKMFVDTINEGKLSWCFISRCVNPTFPVKQFVVDLGERLRGGGVSTRDKVKKKIDACTHGISLSSYPLILPDQLAVWAGSVPTGIHHYRGRCNWRGYWYMHMSKLWIVFCWGPFQPNTTFSLNFPYGIFYCRQLSTKTLVCVSCVKRKQGIQKASASNFTRHLQHCHPQEPLTNARSAV